VRSKGADRLWKEDSRQTQGCRFLLASVALMTGLLAAC
jgi:hypothetical protein